MSESIGLKGFPFSPFCDLRKAELKLAQEYVPPATTLERGMFFLAGSTFLEI